MFTVLKGMFDKARSRMTLSNYLFAAIIFIFCNLGCSNFNKGSATNLSKSEALTLANTFYDNAKLKTNLERKSEMDSRIITVNGIKMKFELKIYGKKPKEGWSLYFSLHGGGQTEPAINEKQWVRHQNLYNVKEGIKYMPNMRRSHDTVSGGDLKVPSRLSVKQFKEVAYKLDVSQSVTSLIQSQH